MFIKESLIKNREEGITGTTIKDTWTKPRGRVERGEGGGFTWGGVEGWGEKAYNCNCITIKKIKKKKIRSIFKEMHLIHSSIYADTQR